MSNKTISKRRYQPAAEFDDVTLARKREYWRSKKREQRARKSSAKKKIGNENLGLCKSAVSDEPALEIPKVDNDPSLHNHGISCKPEDTDAPRNSSSSGLSVSECNVTMVPCQKERWFQKTKLNHVLPKFPETSTNSSVRGSLNTDAKTVEFLCPIGHSMPTTCIELHPNSTLTQKPKTGMSSLIGKELATSPQTHVSMVLPVHNNQNKPQKCLRPLSSAECKVHKEQSLEIAKRRTRAFASKHNTRAAMTEEEMVAKRRENWRIKKQEQRAKRAAKLALDQEGSLGQRQSSCIMSALSPVNSKALRGINLNSANPKCLNQQSFGIKYISSRTQLHVQDKKTYHASLYSCILQPSSSKSKVPQFAHTQKRHCQKPNRKSFLGASKVESPEDRHARKKEYWRIKKREQRARLSTAVKAQLTEQGALKHCGRRCHNSFNQMCGVQVSKAGAFASSSDKIGGFIKEDGTVTVSTSKTTSESSLPASHDFSNVKCNGKVRLQVQVSSPLCSDAQPVTKLVSAPRNVSKAHQNSRVKSGADMGSMTVTIQSETRTEEERIARLREHWRIKKREQRASQAARLGNGLLKSKVSVLKQREQNKKSNKRDSITSSISKTFAPTPIQEHSNPHIHAVFSNPEINPCPSFELNIEPPVTANHPVSTFQAVASMKKLLEESVSTPEDYSTTEMHVKFENEPLLLTKGDLLTSEDAKPNINLQQNILLECDVSEDTSLKDFKMSPQAFPFEDTSHHRSYNICQETADGCHDLSPVAVRPQYRNNQKFSDDGADPKQSCPSQTSQKQQLGESDELQRKREYWRLMKRQQRARKANKDANKTGDERITRLREYWMIKKREQRASRAGRLGNCLLRLKVSVLKQREQNKKSNKRDCITSSISKTVAPTSTVTPIQEHINPLMHAVFSIPEITPSISVKDDKPSPCASLESHIEPQAAVNHHAATLQAVASMKKLLEESVSTPEDHMHFSGIIKCENEPLLLTKDNLLTSEDAKPNVISQQNVLLECDVSEDTSLKDFKMSPQTSTFEDFSHRNLRAANESHALSPVAMQPQCRKTQKFSDGADPKQSCPSQASQQLGESDELQRKREYWRLMKRQQRAKKANQDTAKDANKTEEERITRLREYWMLKKREQRASRAARLGNGLLRWKVSVLKQREQNKKSNKRDCITSSISKTVAPTSPVTPIQEHVNPLIHAVFSIPEITPSISVKDDKPSPCPSLESHIEPPAAANHPITTLQAVASMKKLLEESVSTPEDHMHFSGFKCENEDLLLTKDDLLTSEDAKPNVILQQNVLLDCDVSEDTSLKDIKMSPQTSAFEDISHCKSNNLRDANESHALSPVAMQPQCRKTQKFSDGADPKQSCPSQASQQLGESDELQRKREYWRLMKRQQRAKKANQDTAKDANKTEEERITRLREYWMLKKREQRASRAARLGNGLLRWKVSVLKQREQNKKSNKRDCITSSISKTVAPTSPVTPIQEHVNPLIHAVFSIPEITPSISVKDDKPSPCPSLESHIEPPAAANHPITTLQAVASMKKLLEESVSTPEDHMHFSGFKCENEDLLLTKDDLLTSEDAKPNVILQQNVLLDCDVSEDTSLKDIKMSPQTSAFEDISHCKSNNLRDANESHALSPVAMQPQCRKTQKFSDGADPKQSCPSQASQQLGESDELQRKREYWRLMKRQQRAKKANKDAVLPSLSPQIPSQIPQEKTSSTTLLLAMSQDVSTCRQIPIQKQTRRCTKPVGPQTQPPDNSRTNRSQIVAMPNPQDDPQEVIRRRRMQWRIKKQKQRARKAANERRLHQAMLPPQDQISGENTTSFYSAVVQSMKSEDQLSYLAEPCQTALKEESSFAPNDATEGHLSQAEWRNVYLMDSDPVNPLLVCMVCGEQQYCLSVEAAKTHIEEVHPNTLSLGDLERQGILDAWDKQVAVREHFITHQLQQR